MRLQTPKGFRDFLPQDALKRKFVLDKIIKVFEKFGFDPLETPTVEYEATLAGKYGEEERLIYKFETPGGDKVALKYDQTVPLARVVAQYGPNGSQILPIPFKRYQIQSAYRGENTQKGRYREFTQCDIDIVGAPGLLADAEIISCVLESMKSLSLKNAKMLVNDRSVFKDLKIEYIRAIDKLKKIGQEGVISEFIKYGADPNWAEKFISSFDNTKPVPVIITLFNYLKQSGLEEGKDFEFDPTLARGLDYYTSTIFELVSKEYEAGSLGGGGRYDELINKFVGNSIPAVGFSFGVDRIIEAMELLNLLDNISSSVQVLVTVFSKDLRSKSTETAKYLREKDLNVDLYLNLPENESDYKLDKQLKYADRKGIPFVVIIGPDEAAQNKYQLKSLKDGTQQTLSLDELVAKLSS